MTTSISAITAVSPPPLVSSYKNSTEQYTSNMRSSDIPQEKLETTITKNQTSPNSEEMLILDYMELNPRDKRKKRQVPHWVKPGILLDLKV